MKTRHFIVIIALVTINVWLSFIRSRYEAIAHKAINALTEKTAVIEKLKADCQSEFANGMACGAVATAEEFIRLEKEHPDRPIRASELDADRVVTEAFQLGSNSLVAPKMTQR
jgi:hypothetical protein